MNTPISRPWRRDLRTSAIRPGRYALLLAAAMAAGSAQAAVPASERQALLALFEATAGSQWTERAGWRGPAGSECQWTGVRCDDQQRHVIGLRLSNNQLRGRLPYLGALTQLRELTVSLNYLHRPLPSLRGLTQRRVLKANNNLLDGPVPALHATPRLERLMLANNRLSGVMTASRSHLALREVDISNNLLHGPLPVLVGLPQIRRFDASFNRWQGTTSDAVYEARVLRPEGAVARTHPPSDAI